MRLLFLSLLLALSPALPAALAGGDGAPAAPAGGERVTPEAEARLSPEALARYSAPGDPARYRELILQLKTSGDALGSPATNLRLPVKSWPDGRPRTMVFAETAWIPPSMQSLRGRKVRVESYREDGSLEIELEADEVVVDRTAMLAVAKGCIRGELAGDRLTGRGALIDLNAQYVRILYEASILTRKAGEADFTSRGMF